MPSTEPYGSKVANSVIIVLIVSMHFFGLCSEISQCFNSLSESGDCRAIVLSGAGKHFTAGLDLRESFGNFEKIADLELGRKGLALNKMIKLYQVL